MSYGPAMGAYDEHGPLSTRRRQHASSGSPNARSDSAGLIGAFRPSRATTLAASSWERIHGLL